MKILKLSAAILTCALFAFNCSDSTHATQQSDSSDKLLYHSYSSYGSGDSRLFFLDTSDSASTEISSSSFYNQMNADFGSNMYDVIFMAIDRTHDEWDIYRCNLHTGKIENLTENSGFRNEDPKFSPDGNRIVFKRGYWSSQQHDFVYDLAELSLNTMEITQLTNDIPEDSMPFYSPDGKYIYYAQSHAQATAICRLDRETLATETVFSQEGIHVYYPILSENGLFFTKWLSADNHSDCIVKYENGSLTSMPFNSENYNSSDVFPLNNGTMYYSSTAGGSYDLYYYNGTDSAPVDNTVTENNELGVSCFTQEDAIDITVKTADFLLGRADAEENMDADGDGEVTVFDMVLMRQQITSKAE